MTTVRSAATPSNHAAFPLGLTRLVLGVSMIKASGWALALYATIEFAMIEEFPGYDVRNEDLFFRDLVPLLLVVLLLGSGLWFFQLRSALKRRATPLFRVALIMTILDLLALLYVFSLGSFVGAGVGSFWAPYAVVAFVQMRVAVGAQRVRCSALLGDTGHASSELQQATAPAGRNEIDETIFPSG